MSLGHRGRRASTTYSVLHSFSYSPHGTEPSALLRHAQGNLYGTTYEGGANGFGVVFKLDTAGRQILLHSFGGGTDGGNPNAGVVSGPAGNLYGTTYYGGVTDGGTYSSGCGVVYKIDTSGHHTVLYRFTGGTDGGAPSGVILDAAGNLYGTAYSGGGDHEGVVFKLTPAGQQTVLYTFTGSLDGGHPSAGVTADSGGNLGR
jgi:uncharacterized repeat protein (TIGR03803 family)